MTLMTAQEMEQDVFTDIGLAKIILATEMNQMVHSRG